MSLADAQRAKLDRLCTKLGLGPDDHVSRSVPGGVASPCTPPPNYGCRVTTTTISDAQFEFASKRVADDGLADRVTVLDRDYRDLTGTYDKLVSIEMIEAVDWRQHDAFFGTCASLLRDDGLMALQAITVDDRSFATGQERHRLRGRSHLPRRVHPVDRGDHPIASASHASDR